MRSSKTFWPPQIRKFSRNLPRPTALLDPRTGKRADVGVIRVASHAPYLRTHADGDWNDNLLSLNQCPL